MAFKRVDAEDLAFFERIMPGRAHSGAAISTDHMHDEMTEYGSFAPDAVLLAETAEEICEKHCVNDPAEEEYTEAETSPDVRVYDGEVEENARASSATFNWTVYPNSLTRTAKTIRAEAGEWISVSVRNPSGRPFRAGIIHPNGSKRYVSGTTEVSHTFTISETGYYRVYVENPGDTTISVTGGYVVY